MQAKKIKRIFFILLGTIIFNLIFLEICEAKSKRLSDQSEISLLTCSPGSELYSIFGHCAIRVYDPIQKIDNVYNYGTFDYNAPNFYLEFIRGKLMYFLTVSSYTIFKNEYIRDNRSIYEQKLFFSFKQRQLLYEYLENNYLPENRNYLYHFFYENCATKIRDAIVNSSPKHINIIFSQKKKISFRQLINPYIKHYPWLDLGINLVLGASCDRIAKPYEHMFLPDYLMEMFQGSIQKKSNITDPLIKKRHLVFKAIKSVRKGINLFSPVVTFWSLFLLFLVFTYMEYKNKIRFLWIDIILFFTVGLSGIVLLLLWFGTDHTVTAYNLNLLWAIPFHFPVIFFINKKKLKFINTYFLITGILMVLILITWPINPQKLHTSLIPIILILSLRSFKIYFHRKT